MSKTFPGKDIVKALRRKGFAVDHMLSALPGAKDSFRLLEKSVQIRIADKIEWLVGNADKMIHLDFIS